MNRIVNVFCGTLMLTAILASSTFGDVGQPIAIRSWQGRVISIENQWGLSIAIEMQSPTAKDQLALLADRGPVQVVEFDKNWNHVLSRPANQADANWTTVKKVNTNTDNQVLVTSIIVEDRSVALAVETDGVRILILASKLVDDQALTDLSMFEKTDVLFITAMDPETLKLDRLIDAVKPRRVLLSHEGQSTLPSEEKLTSLFGDVPVKITSHNTAAVSANPDTDTKLLIESLSTTPWIIPDSMSELFVAMEKSCSDSQEVFRVLTVEQMNFKPSNGTHTPRWNVEHMMGRQLQFFSQIYHQIDPAIPVMNQNPKQMPPDYVFAHPDWTGAEEARQMQRVSDFTRRFAFLLDGLDVDQKPPASSWPTLRALLVQMQRHYSEHTANTVKKFELPEWPGLK